VSSIIPIQDTVSFRLARVCRAHRNLATVMLDPLGLHPGQDLIMVELWVEEGLTQSRLAERVGVDVSTMTKALQRLERYGLVRRCQDVEDSRVSRVFLTDRGRDLEPTITAEFAAIEERTLAGLTPDERALLSRLLERMEATLT